MLTCVFGFESSVRQIVTFWWSNPLRGELRKPVRPLKTSMADADSLYELSSDQDVDPDAIDGDVENDDTADDGYICFSIVIYS